jgi:hypothetical protein
MGLTKLSANILLQAKLINKRITFCGNVDKSKKIFDNYYHYAWDIVLVQGDCFFTTIGTLVHNRNIPINSYYVDTEIFK